jgi:hypothetical protein
MSAIIPPSYRNPAVATLEPSCRWGVERRIDVSEAILKEMVEKVRNWGKWGPEDGAPRSTMM